MSAIRRIDRAPTGPCLLCDRPATQWIGRIVPLPDGRVVRQATPMCELHGLVPAKKQLA